SSWRRAAAGKRVYSNGRQSRGLQDRARLGCLDRPCSEAKLKRRKRTAWQYHQGRKPLSQADACCGCHGGDPLCRTVWNAPPMARSADAAAPGEGGGGCAGKQNGAHNLGTDDERRTLSRTHRYKRASGIGTGAAEAPLKLGRADRSECTKPVETAGSGKPTMSPALRVRGTDWDLRRAKGIMASGAWKGRMTGRTHGRTDQRWADASKNPCQRRAVHTRTQHQRCEVRQDRRCLSA